MSDIKWTLIENIDWRRKDTNDLLFWTPDGAVIGFWQDCGPEAGAWADGDGDLIHPTHYARIERPD